jgi:hypothetical protein
MQSPRTLVAQTREDVLAVYCDALIAWTHGEPIDTAAVNGEIETILRNAFDKAGAAWASQTTARRNSPVGGVTAGAHTRRHM